MTDSTLIAAVVAAAVASVNTLIIVIGGYLMNNKLEDVKSQLNLRLHVHKVKFEKEFQVLEEIWAALVKLRNAGDRFKSGWKSGDNDPNRDRQNFGEAYGDLLRLIDSRRPFFPQEIFLLLEDYRQLQFRWFQHNRRITDPQFKIEWLDKNYWGKIDENLKEIDCLFEEVLKAIRKRTETMP